MFCIEGDPREVLGALHRRAKLRAIGEPDGEQIWGIGCPGGQLIGHGTGKLQAMQDEGLSHIFDGIVCGSSAACAGAFFLAEQMYEGAKICIECAENDMLLSVPRFKMTMSSLEIRTKLGFNLDLMGEKIRSLLNEDAVRCSPTDFYVTLTDEESGEGEFKNARKAEPDIAHLICASMAHPILTYPLEYKGKKKVDGVVAEPCPVHWVLDKLPTILIIYANGSPERTRLTIVERILIEIMFARRRKIKDLLVSSPSKAAEEIRLLKNSTCKYLVVYDHPGALDSLEKDPLRIEVAIKKSREHMHHLLREAKDSAHL